MARLLIVEDHSELASLMAAAAHSRGHEAVAVHTGEAALALLSPASFEAAIVDLLLPDMRGSAVLAALRDHAIPAVAVSGVFKGHQFAREATEVHGARAFFEKPFELLQLLESVEQLCGLTRAETPAHAEHAEEVVVLVDEPVFPQAEDEPGPTTARDEPLFHLSADEPLFAPPEEQAPIVQGLSLAEAPEAEPQPVEAEPERNAPVIPITQALSAQEEPAPEAREEPAREEPAPATGPEPGIALPFAEREKVWAKASTPGARRRPPPEWSLAGNLRDTSVPRLLNAYYETRHGGELKLRQGTLLKVVYFELGHPVYAASNVPQERFLRFCVRRGVLPQARMLEVVTLTREQGLRTAEAMMRLGLLDEQRHRQLLEEQVKEILWSTFTWSEGAYGYSRLRPPSAGRVRLSVFPGDLILEGVLRTEPLVTLRRNVPPSRRLFPQAAPPYGLHELKLQGPQALLLAYADGSKTVEDLLTLTELPEREALATLRGLELLGVLEERREEPSRSRISFGL